MRDWSVTSNDRPGLPLTCVGVEGPNEILLGQSKWVPKLVGIPLGGLCAIFVEGGGGLGVLMLGGHGSGGWALNTQSNLLF